MLAISSIRRTLAFGSNAAQNLRTRVSAAAMATKSQLSTSLSPQLHPSSGHSARCTSSLSRHYSTTLTTTLKKSRQRQQLMNTQLNAAASFSGSASSQPPQIRHVGKQEMRQLIEECESQQQSNSADGDDADAAAADEGDLVIIDVRSGPEIVATGKLSPCVRILPIEVIAQYSVFSLDEYDFEDICGFPKPRLDQTLVFTCKAGVRSVYACQFAAQQGGYSQLVNYVGGSSEWFSPY